ncbi:MAG: 50S ribosomal protein L10 [Rhizobacter sp.]|nr:50S ribosomal protein L10 [Chlorobiales bacterium]
MKRDEKEKIVADVAEKFKKAQGIYLTEYQGLTVEQATKLRNEFRKSGIEYEVIKNTLAKKAMQQANISDKMFVGLKNTTGVAFGYDDPIAPAKIIKKFAADNDKLKLKLASVEGQVFEGKRLDELAGMFSRLDNIGRVAGTINAVMRNLAYAISEIGKQKEAAAAPVAAVAETTPVATAPVAEAAPVATTQNAEAPVAPETAPVQSEPVAATKATTENSATPEAASDAASQA